MTEKRTEGDGLSPTAKGMRAASPYLNAVWKLVGGAVFGVLAGYLLDQWLGTAPFGVLGLSALGIGVGFYAFIREMLRLGKQ